MSLRFRASKEGMKNVPMPSDRALRGWAPTQYARQIRKINTLRKVRNIRAAQQAESGLAEFMFELIPVMGGEPLKKVAMSDKEAGIRNASIRDLGLAWRRCPY